MFGGRPVEKSTGKDLLKKWRIFFKAHYEQHVSGGTIEVGDERFELSGLGLRDKSWGAGIGRQLPGTLVTNGFQ